MPRPGFVFHIVYLVYKTAQERFRNYNPIVLGLKKSKVLYRDFFTENPLGGHLRLTFMGDPIGNKGQIYSINAPR